MTMTISDTLTLEQSLGDIAQSLAAIGRSMNLSKQKLGFGPSPGRTYIYVNRTQGCNWYSLTTEGKPEPIVHLALTGYVVGLEIRSVQRRGQPVDKLHLHVQANRYYILEAGVQSTFSKGAIAALATLKPEDLLQPITLEPVAGDSDEVLFARLFLKGEPIRTSWDDQTDFQTLTQQVAETISAAQR
jgi:hypothetical protein